MGGCHTVGSGEDAAESPTTQSAKTLDGAEADGQEMVDRYTSGDFAGAWEMQPKVVREAFT